MFCPPTSTSQYFRTSPPNTMYGVLPRQRLARCCRVLTAGRCWPPIPLWASPESSSASRPPGGGRVAAAAPFVAAAEELLGKPADEGDARRMLRLLSGRSHEVMTGVCLLRY